MTQQPAMTDTMRAVVLTGHGGFDKLEYHDDWPIPTPTFSQVLVKVHACGLNNTDVNTRTAWYSKNVSQETTGSTSDTASEEDAAWGGTALTFPRIQGADVAGTVVAIGAGVDKHLVGKRILIDTWLRDWDDPLNLDKCGYFGSECDGGFADYVAIDQRNVYPVDTDRSHAELATFATSYVTAENMLNRAHIKHGDVVLISGASGGVGSALIQLANRRGATTLAMSGASKRDQVAAIGPDAVLSRAPENLKAALRQAIGQDAVDVIADVVGGPYWAQLIDVLARGGRYTCAGAIAGPMVEMDLRTLYLRDLTFTGATIVPPGVFGDLVGYIERDEIKPLLAKTYPLSDFIEAQQAFIEKQHVGNIVVILDDR